jgi:hypothetical protein
MPAAVARPASGALTWTVSKSLKLHDGAGFTAAAATGPGTAWTFLDVKPVAWHLAAGHWSSTRFPDERGAISYAAASGPDNVWAFGLNGAGRPAAYRFNGTRWALAHKFGGAAVISAAVISSSDVYVITAAGTRGRLATLHYNGRTWRQVPAARNLRSVSALTAGNIWAIRESSVAHFRHGKWRYTPVRSLLPRKDRSCGGTMSDVYAQSATSVWAVDSTGCGSAIRPVLLHYTGRHWHAASTKRAIGGVISIVPDGAGGLWLATQAEPLTSSALVHFAHGKFTKIRQPAGSGWLDIAGLAHERRSTVSYAVGTISPLYGSTNNHDRALVLRNS